MAHLNDPKLAHPTAMAVEGILQSAQGPNLPESHPTFSILEDRMPLYRALWTIIIILGLVGLWISLKTDSKMALVFVAPLLAGPWTLWRTRHEMQA